MPKRWVTQGLTHPASVVDRLRRRRRPEVRVFRDYERWLAQELCSPGQLNGPKISVLVPVYNTPAPFLRACLGSVRAQTYADWELCIADDASPAPHVASILAEFSAHESRARHVRLPENAGIAAATNAALGLATGDFIALLDHDDELAPHALARIAAELAAFPDAGVIFSDEDQLLDGQRCRPYFKPGWNPDLMLCQNLVSHLGVYRTTLARRIGGMRSQFTGSQDYDFALRAIACLRPEQIRHVPEILYHWRQHLQSFSAVSMAACQGAAHAALAETLGGRADVVANPDIPQWTRIVEKLPSPAPTVSIILAARAAMPTDPDYEGAVEAVFGGAGQATGDVLIFLAPGVLAARPGWLRELVSQALRPGIACAGGRLDRPDGRILESWLTLHPGVVVQTLAPGSDAGDPGYFGHFLLARSVSAVSRACLALRRDLFEQAGGFDARAGDFADVDLCLRLAGLGLRCVWTPHARLRFRAPPPRLGGAFMRARWGDKLAQDPYLNANLTIRHGALRLEP